MGELSPTQSAILWVDCMETQGETSDFLQRIGILDGSVAYQCVFCKNELETVQHVLIICPLVWKVWTGLLQ